MIGSNLPAEDRMRVLMAHNEYARPSGEEHAVQAIADLLGQRGHDVRWFLRSSSDIHAARFGQVRAFFSGIYSIRSRLEMGRILDREKMDIVQVQNLYPLLSASVLLACRKRGVPVVMRCPNYRLFCPTGLHLSRGRICKRCVGGRVWWCVLRNCEGGLLKSIGYAVRTAAAGLTGMIVDNVNVFVVLSQFQRQRFIAGGIDPDRVEVLPNMVNTPPGEQETRGDTIAFVGRLSPEKGIEDFVKAARALPDCKFAVAGETSRMPDLVLRAPRNVEFHGFIEGRKLDDFFRNARFLVFPSVWYEGFPNGVARAMGLRKPVIASRLGALPEIVDDGATGLLFEPGNADDLVEKIMHLWTHPDECRAMGRAGYEKVKREYSPDRCYRKLLAIYEKARCS